MIVHLMSSGFFFITVVALIVLRYIKKQEEIAPREFLNKNTTGMIKGVAAIAIVIGHIATCFKNPELTGILKLYNTFCLTLGGLGVNLFLFLSGYGNWFSLKKQKHAGAKGIIIWLINRILQVLVVYLILFICETVIFTLRGELQLSSQYIFIRLFRLSMPFTPVWYIRIQLLVYVFLALVKIIKKESYQLILLTIMCFASAYLLYINNYDEYWWKSTLCFAEGAVFAYCITHVQLILKKNKTIIKLASLGTLPFFYYLSVFPEHFYVKVIFNILLTVDMLLLVYFFFADSKWYQIISIYSLNIYLSHRSFCSSLVERGVKAGNIDIIKIWLWTVTLSFFSAWLSKVILNCRVHSKHKKTVI